MDTSLIDSESWWKKIKSITDEAKVKGTLKSMDTIVESVVDENIEFVIRMAKALQQKPSNIQNLGQKPSNFNPFLPPDADLFVSEIFNFHNLVLNKFNVTPFHMILATKDFQSQLDPLNKNDFKALWFCIKTFGMLGFYNCGKDSGASQPHKHIQMLPIPTEKIASNASFPLEPLFQKFSSNVNAEDIFQIEALPFKHACIRFTEQLTKSSPEEAAEKLESLYNKLMDHLNLHKVDLEGTKPSYNFVMTEHFMWISPRMLEKSPFGNISVNSVGFTGAILVKSEEDLKVLKEVGPLRVLKSVTFPK